LSSSTSDSLSSSHEQELARFRQSRFGRVFRLVFNLCLVTFVIGLTVLSFVPQETDEQAIERARFELNSQSGTWGKQFSEQQSLYRAWFLKHGTSGERKIFDDVILGLTYSITNYIKHVSGSGEAAGIVTNLLISLHFGLLRVAFLVVACWRLWILFVGIACYRGWKSWKVHSGPDLLGDTGNGRLFYSGLRIGLEDLSAGGAPNKQVMGLACPKQATAAALEKSKLADILKRYSVNNSCNLTLASIIVAHRDFPAYVARQDEDSLLSDAFMPMTLEDTSAAILERALDLHAFYMHEESDEDFLDYLEQESEQASEDNKLDHEEYSKQLQRAFHRSLTPNMRKHLINISAEKIATIVLAYEAGKTMAYGKGGGKWLRTSNYTQLSARAVMHSVEGFVKEYNFEERTTIRHAIIFGSRLSDFGPIKLPLNMSDESRAARQWVELLMSCPNELQTVSDEVEMYGIVCEVHARWTQLIFDGVMTSSPDTTDGVYATQGNLFLMPLSKVVKLTRQCIPSKLLSRLSVLVAAVSQQQRLKALAVEASSEDSLRGGIPAYARVFPPLSEQEIKALAQSYQIPTDVIRDWGSLRIILNQFGWLARRVGDYSVPESSIIFAVMNSDGANINANELGLIGVAGMVPLRGTRFEEKWGKTWQSRFTQVLSATMAESRDEFDKLMRGERREESEEATSANL